MTTIQAALLRNYITNAITILGNHGVDVSGVSEHRLKYQNGKLIRYFKMQPGRADEVIVEVTDTNGELLQVLTCGGGISCLTYLIAGYHFLRT
jgi:hypothetical protein